MFKNHQLSRISIIMYALSICIFFIGKYFQTFFTEHRYLINTNKKRVKGRSTPVIPRRKWILSTILLTSESHFKRFPKDEHRHHISCSSIVLLPTITDGRRRRRCSKSGKPQRTKRNIFDCILAANVRVRPVFEDVADGTHDAGPEDDEKATTAVVPADRRLGRPGQPRHSGATQRGRLRTDAVRPVRRQRSAAVRVPHGQSARVRRGRTVRVAVGVVEAGPPNVALAPVAAGRAVSAVQRPVLRHHHADRPAVRGPRRPGAAVGRARVRRVDSATSTRRPGVGRAHVPAPAPDIRARRPVRSCAIHILRSAAASGRQNQARAHRRIRGAVEMTRTSYISTSPLHRYVALFSFLASVSAPRVDLRVVDNCSWTRRLARLLCSAPFLFDRLVASRVTDLCPWRFAWVDFMILDVFSIVSTCRDRASNDVVFFLGVKIDSYVDE